MRHEKIKKCVIVEECIHPPSCEPRAMALQEGDYKEVLYMTVQTCVDLLPWDLISCSCSSMCSFDPVLY